MLKIKLIMMLSIKYMFYYLNLDICNIVINIYIVVKSIVYKCICICICSKFIIVRLKCRLGLFFVIGFFFCEIKNVELMVLNIRIKIVVLLILKNIFFLKIMYL